jgi:hypothetical protein
MMDQDREQKIHDVYEAMVVAYLAQYPGAIRPEPTSSTHLAYMRNARAAVDVLSPVKRIELSGGFHAEPAPADPMRCNIFDRPGPHTIRIIGNLSRDAARAWAEAAISHQKLNQHPSDQSPTPRPPGRLP